MSEPESTSTQSRDYNDRDGSARFAIACQNQHQPSRGITTWQRRPAPWATGRARININPVEGLQQTRKIADGIRQEARININPVEGLQLLPKGRRVEG